MDRDIAAAFHDAAVGREALSVSLTEADAIEAARTDDNGIRVTVSLPVPATALRDRIESDLRDVADDVPNVDGVAVDWRPRAADPGVRGDYVPNVRNVVAVSSGKGGVGKSTVASNLAVALADAGASVGLVDADVYGPNAPKMLGLSDGSPATTADDEMVPREAHGVTVMSMGFLVGEDDPVIWRGPVVDDMLQQLFDDVRWGDLDYLIVDLPPGTGDAQLSLVQHLPVTGAVVVTTPQAVATDDARRGLQQFRRYDVPVLGVVENMAGFQCPDCDAVHDIFDSGGAEALAEEFGVPHLGSVPLDPAVGEREVSGESPPGVSIPLVGRLQLPRTQTEREQRGTLPPMAIREEGGQARRSLRALSSRVAARVNVEARRMREAVE